MKQKSHQAKATATETMQPAVLALVFALGVQTMIVELSLPRLLAPVFGNTLFCWTAAISVVLAALAVGYHLGGMLSTRKTGSHSQLIWWLAAFSSAWVVLVGLMGDRVVKVFSGTGMILGPLVVTLILAVPPAGIGATVLPICVALTAKQAGSGKSAGRLYAFSTVGSVLGVLVTGYLLLPMLGVSGSYYSAAAFVFATFFLGRKFIAGIFGLIVVVLLYTAVSAHRTDNVLMDKSNGYHRIKVVSAKKDPAVRSLIVDSALEGAVKLGSKNPGLKYQRHGVIIAEKLPGIKRCFFLGGGTFSMPGFIKHRHPDVVVDVAEIDKDIVDAAGRFFELSPDLNVYVGDARRVLSARPTSYDLIMNDAFHGLRRIPFHLVTRQFHQLVAEKLTPGGVYAVNVMGHFLESRLVNSMIKTLKSDFTHVNVVRVGAREIQNIWLLAGKQPIAIGTPAAVKGDAGMVFTDNHAPVEFLVALEFARETAVTTD